ncbi:hypothetical protein ACWCPQ_28460 [Nocardia sp. NPDC001965]
MIRRIADQLRQRLLASLGPGRADASAADLIEGNCRQAGALAREGAGVTQTAEEVGRARLCLPPPDRATLARTRQDLDRELRRRFGDRGPDEDGWGELMKEDWPTLRQYAVIDRQIDDVAVRLGRDSDAVRAQMREELRIALAGKPIAIRVRDRELVKILDEGRIPAPATRTGPAPTPKNSGSARACTKTHPYTDMSRWTECGPRRTNCSTRCRS